MADTRGSADRIFNHGILGKNRRSHRRVAFGKGRDIGVNGSFHLFGCGHGIHSGK